MSDNDDLDFGQTIRGLVEGQTAFGRYQLKRILGRGGMGIVWLAWDEKLEEEIALKFMPEMVRLDDAGIRDLKRETRKSLNLTHANIVRIRDFVVDDCSSAIPWLIPSTLPLYSFEKSVNAIFRSGMEIAK